MILKNFHNYNNNKNFNNNINKIFINNWQWIFIQYEELFIKKYQLLPNFHKNITIIDILSNNKTVTLWLQYKNNIDNKYINSLCADLQKIINLFFSYPICQKIYIK